MIPLDSPQPEYHVPAPNTIPDDSEDQPVAGKSVQSESASYGLPSLIFGAAALSTVYSKQEDLESPTPLRTVRLALRYGINSFDTSPYYGASEIILGQILQALKNDYPRSSYTLITKCGRYGFNRSEFDYSPTTVRRSIERSLKRLGTTYLDTVYMHDVEFVATPVWPKPNDGNHALVLTDENLAKQWGLSKGDEDKVHGEGDQKVLDAVAELRKLQEEGIIKTVGISGYPLPTLLRLSLLILHKTGKPLDIVLSFSQYNLQNTTFAAFFPEFTQRAKVARVLTASPFSMGLLTNSPPDWHPAPGPLKDLVKRVIESDEVKTWAGGLPNIALGYSFRREGTVMGQAAAQVPTVVGFSNTQHVHESVAVWREVCTLPGEAERRKAAENGVIKMFENEGWMDKSWPNGPKEWLV
ncbi:hypothetical protein FRC04_000131 [Tulasnella sp. 424]|nr:hypothetical protein FRC04_000131 [Tulasnella sp. 424]KAG8981994.1 hypothetical protein FRC05_000136 [Tulasnella sp. 425]